MRDQIVLGCGFAVWLVAIAIGIGVALVIVHFIVKWW
jgi:hypothetical protein